MQNKSLNVILIFLSYDLYILVMERALEMEFDGLGVK